MSTKLDELAELLQKQAKRQVPIQTEWCLVKEVDWDDKTMTVESLLNDLEYFDVLLGLGSIYKKPVPGTKCLIGLIANSNACFMIDCEAFEEMVIVSDKSQFTIKEAGFIVKQEDESFKTIVNDLIDSVNNQNAEIRKLDDVLKAVVVSVGVSPNVPELVQIKQSLLGIVNVNNEIRNRFNQIFTA